MCRHDLRGGLPRERFQDRCFPWDVLINGICFLGEVSLRIFYLGGRPLIIWGEARRKLRKKNSEALFQEKNKFQKGLSQEKKISRGLLHEKQILKRHSCRRNKSISVFSSAPPPTSLMVDPLEGHFFPAFSTSPHSNRTSVVIFLVKGPLLNWIEKWQKSSALRGRSLIITRGGH